MKKKFKGEEAFKIASRVAEHYGFQSVESAEAALKRPGKDKKPFSLKTPGNKRPGVGERLQLAKILGERTGFLLSEPILFYHSEPLPTELPRKDYGGTNAVFFSLEAVGSNSSVVEALILSAGKAIVEELGFSPIEIHLNSVGDRESMSRFTREFTAYASKHLEEIPTVCRTHLARKDALKTMECIDEHEDCKQLAEDCPKPVSCLSEDSRKHFAEVLEYAEGLAWPYQISHCLVGGKDWYNKTILEIRSNSALHSSGKKLASLVLGKGGRYDTLVRRFGFKKDLPAVGLSISLGGLGLVEAASGKPKKFAPPKIHLLQIGWSAKVKSLKVLEILRLAQIPITHNLVRDRLAAQIGALEKSNITHTVIIGQREALENTAIIRDMKTRSQITVPIAELARHLKKVVRKK